LNLEVTRILDAVQAGDSSAAASLLPLVYDELRSLAAARLRQEGGPQSLNATGLVHEAYLRLLGPEGRGADGWSGRGHFSLPAALTELAKEDPQKAELVSLRFFGGLSQREAAAVLGVSMTTADRHWAYARAWLLDALDGDA